MKRSAFTRSGIAIGMAIVLGLSAVAPASAGSFPVGVHEGQIAAPMTEDVQYRPYRERSRGGNGGATAAVVIGALAIGAAAIIAKRAERKREKKRMRAFYEQSHGYPHGGHYPPPHDAYPPPGYGHPQPYYRGY